MGYIEHDVEKSDIILGIKHALEILYDQYEMLHYAFEYYLKDEMS